MFLSQGSSESRIGLALISGTVGVIVLGGCGGETASRDGTIVTDSAGIRIVEGPRLPEAPAPIRVSDEPVYRVGWDEQQHTFETLSAGALLEGGAAVVVDGGRSQRLVLLSPTGSIEGLLGGPGQGPGEFIAVSSLAVHRGDTILVQDSRNGRLSRFTRDGFVESIPVQGLSLLYLHGADPQSGAAMLGMPLAMVMGRRYETPFLQVPLVRVEWPAGHADTVGMADWDQSIEVGGGNNPFMSGGFLSVSGGDFVVGRGDRAEIRWIDPEGAVRQIVRWATQPTEIPDSLMAEWESRTRARFEGGGLPVGDIEARIAAMKDAMQEPLPLFGIPGSMPRAGGLLVDPYGNVWIAGYRAPGHGPPQVYFVMSPQGEWLGAVEMPNGVQVLDIGRSYLLAVERNEFDVEAAALYRIDR